MTVALAGLVTFVFTTVLTIAGVGAAFILIPVFVAGMMLFYRPRPREATASRAGLLGLGVAVGGLAGFIGGLLGVGGGNIIVPVLVALGSVSAALVGSWLMTDRLEGRQVKVLIGVVLLVVAAKMSWGLVGVA